MAGSQRYPSYQNIKSEDEHGPQAGSARGDVSVTDLRVLSFRVAGQEYVVDLRQVHEILDLDGLAPLQGAPSYVAGVVSHYGHVVPIVDLGKRLGLPVSVRTPDTCAILIELSIGPVGFVADGVSGLTWISTQEFEALSPVVIPIDTVFVQGVACLDGRTLVLLDLERVVGAPELTTMGEAVGRHLAASQPAVTLAKPMSLSIVNADEGTTEQGLNAQAREVTRTMVLFNLGQEPYAVPAVDVVELCAYQRPLPLPRGPGYIAGLIAVRGVVLPVVDLRRLLGIGEVQEHPEGQFVVVKGPGYDVAWWVDRVEDMVRLPEQSFRSVPVGGGFPGSQYLDTIAVMNGRTIYVLSVPAILAGTTPKSGVAASSDLAR